MKIMKVFSLWGIIILLISSCSTIKLEKPVLNHSNSNNYNIGRYWKSESDSDAYEIVEIEASDIRSKGLYIVKNHRGIIGMVRIAPTDVQGRYVTQLHFYDSESTIISLAVVNTQNMITIYEPTSSIYDKAVTSPYLHGLISHIADKEGIVFDEYICENYGPKIIAFIKSLELSDFNIFETYHTTTQEKVDKIWENKLSNEVVKYLDKRENMSYSLNE